MSETLFWNISKLSIACSETPFSNNSYYTETTHIICNPQQFGSFENNPHF